MVRTFVMSGETVAKGLFTSCINLQVKFTSSPEMKYQFIKYIQGFIRSENIQSTAENQN